MELFSLQFLYALGAIVLIDLVLAGDNAIVIALAARKLPPALQKRAIVWGTVGAIAVRSLMTVVVVWLLKIPGLLLVGGALLVWIAVKLLAPQESHGEGEHAGADNFWGAMKTIVIADAVMGLDNVLAVAGAAHGSFLLVVLGLLISIPIVVWGSTLILKWVERFPIIIYAGAGVLAWTAAKMMLGEPLVKDWVAPYAGYAWIAQIGLIGFVLGFGYLLNTRHRMHQAVALPTPAISPKETAAMTTLTHATRDSSFDFPAVTDAAVTTAKAAHHVVLVPVNDSAAARAAIADILTRSPRDGTVQVHLAHFTPALHRHISRFLPTGAASRWAKENRENAITPAVEKLRAAGFEVRVHLLRSRDLIASICKLAEELGCGRIVIGSRRKSALAHLFTFSVAARILEHADVPVEVVLYGQPSVFTRYALPAGVGALFAALAID